MTEVYRNAKRIGEGECPHCSGGWIADQVETSFGEFEDVAYLCHMCSPASVPSDPTPETPDSRREKSARKLFRERAREFTPLGGARYLVPSRSNPGTTWEVDVDGQTCRCPDHAAGGNRCAHIRAAGMHMEAEIAEKRRTAEKRAKTARRESPSNFAENVRRMRG